MDGSFSFLLVLNLINPPIVYLRTIESNGKLDSKAAVYFPSNFFHPIRASTSKSSMEEEEEEEEQKGWNDKGGGTKLRLVRDLFFPGLAAIH